MRNIVEKFLQRPIAACERRSNFGYQSGGHMRSTSMKRTCFDLTHLLIFDVTHLTAPTTGDR